MSGNGFVFGATKPRHRILARRAARTLRRVMPDAQIDLYTDRKIKDDVFDRVVKLDRNWHRPKIEALRRSRFERTVYLDNDIITVADASDIFVLLERFDIVGVHDNNRNSRNATGTAGPALPAAFPSINGGVLGIRRCPEIQQLLTDWEARMEANGMDKDQPSLRSLLWESDLRLGILPIEYNLMNHPLIPALTEQCAAPRFIHMRELNRLGRPAGDPAQPFHLSEFYGRRQMAHLRGLIDNDATLGNTPASSRWRMWYMDWIKARPFSLRYLLTTKLRQRKVRQNHKTPAAAHSKGQAR